MYTNFLKTRAKAGLLLVRKMVKFNIFMKEDVKSRERLVLETGGDE